MNRDLNELRKSLISEAINSPMLLSDLAGMENYVSESYNCRSFIELLQNADDVGATAFYVCRYNDYIFVANNGRPFDIKDVESLCRSASSNKVRGASIGYRGIGFKSVVSFAREIHLISGDFKITFSKELSRVVVPQAQRIPLIRIPHDIRTEVVKEIENELARIQSAGYSTVFIFSGNAANQIDEEYTSFKYSTLLFLNSVKNIKVSLSKTVTASVSYLDKNDKGRKLRIITDSQISDWLVCTKDGCSIAFNIENGIIKRLPKSEALIHAFLPTEDSCGLGVVVNGDFSTDPSRRHLILDNKTKTVISNLCAIYLNLLKKCLQIIDDEAKGYLEALTPYFDAKLIQLMKQSFEKEFATQIKSQGGPLFRDIKISPSWFNATDYNKIATIMGCTTISPVYERVAGMTALLKYIGCKTDDISTLVCHVNDGEISLLGYAQLAVAGIRSINMNQEIDKFSSSPLFLSGGRLFSLKELNDNEQLLIDDSFIQLLLDNGLSRNDMGLCLTRLSMDNLYERQFYEKPIEVTKTSDKTDKPKVRTNVEDWFNNIPDVQTPSNEFKKTQKWRSAEENTLSVLNAHGFNLKDVSTLNVGYDLDGIDPNGKEICIEVKSIDYAGQKFRMTNNEFAAAQFKQDRYYLAIVLMGNDTIEISLIKNPVNNLNMNRQCVQWIWECAEYEFNPMKFKM